MHFLLAYIVRASIPFPLVSKDSYPRTGSLTQDRLLKVPGQVPADRSTHSRQAFESAIATHQAAWNALVYVELL